jgi:MoaA/NifB/PqqE/SkfB family radical SAM enzyme
MSSDEYNYPVDEVTREKLHDWLDTNNFCAMPFFHVAVESNGDVRPCCLGKELINDDGTKFNISGTNMGINDIINHPTHIKFRESFLKNEQHPACNHCWGPYHKDRFNGRHVYTTSLKVNRYVKDIMEGKPPEQKLLWLEIKAGNRCNLSCRICGLWNSAKWLKDAYEVKKAFIGESYPAFPDSYEFKYNQQAKWIDNIDFWRNIEGFDDIKIIHIMGGEPMMIEEHFEMLQAIADKFDASKIRVWYNTNGTRVPTPEQEALLDKFQCVMWSVSIDDFGPRFEYQRKGADWQDVKKNLPYFFSKPNYESTIDATINIYNIYTINEFIAELDRMNLAQHFCPHYVTTPNGPTNVRALNSNIKEIIKQHLIATKDTSTFKTRISAAQVDKIIKFMMDIDEWSPDTDQYRKFEIFKVDELRNESFVEIFPEMSKLLNYE